MRKKRSPKQTTTHKNPSPTQQNNQTQTTDNTTNVYIRLDEPKNVVSFRCNKALWLAFKKQIRAQGLSICHVLEPMIFGWLNGYVNISTTIRPVRIENIVVERAVKRVRRYAVEEFAVSEKFYCGLKDRHVPRGNLPLFECRDCLNVKCRDFVFHEVKKV